MAMFNGRNGMEKIKVAILSLLAAACIASAKPPDAKAEIKRLEEKYQMVFKAEVPLANEGGKAWIFLCNEKMHDQPIVILVPRFPTEEIIKWATMTSAGEVEELWIVHQKDAAPDPEPTPTVYQ
jgi:hypothetical protein